jgi:hypothetical protein
MRPVRSALNPYSTPRGPARTCAAEGRPPCRRAATAAGKARSRAACRPSRAPCHAQAIRNEMITFFTYTAATSRDEVARPPILVVSMRTDTAAPPSDVVLAVCAAMFPLSSDLQVGRRQHATHCESAFCLSRVGAGVELDALQMRNGLSVYRAVGTGRHASEHPLQATRRPTSSATTAPVKCVIIDARRLLRPGLGGLLARGRSAVRTA